MAEQTTPASGGAPRPLYVLADTSGSTVRAGVNEGWNLAQPWLVSAVAAGGPDRRICLITYGTDAVLRVPLISACDLTMVPWMPAAGLSSMAAGLRLLARTIREDRQQLRSDQIPVGASVALIVADGLPTDTDEQVLDARALVGDGSTMHIVAPPGEDVLAFTGLRATFHALDTDGADRVARSIVAAARAALDNGTGG